MNCFGVQAQNIERSYTVNADTIITDSLTIDASTIKSSDVNGNVIISVLPNGKSISITKVNAPLTIQYKTIPIDLSHRYFHRSLDLYDSQAQFRDIPIEVKQATKGWLEQKGISHQGTLTRGITVGSHQSLTMQSQMNLQLEGKLNDDLFVSADITDQRVPYLPEGNSQYLRDFDNVSVKLYNDKFLLEAGDQLWSNNASFFGSYSRNMEGARFQYKGKSKLGNTLTYIGAASAKGKFSRQELKIEDGVTGPYRIPQPASGGNVVILPGTEKVFIDGKQLVRGFDNDYIIDYNQGEITFTNEVVLTMYSRVIVEFEYTQLTYQQTSLMAGHQIESEKYKFYLSYFQQNDNANQPLGIDLTSKDRDIIAEKNPNENFILLSGIDSIGYNPELIMYALKDSVTSDGRLYPVYFHSKDPKKAHYRLTFRESENGNYIIKTYSGEGRIFQWVAPINGIPQGNYEPEIALNTPEKQQLFSVGGSYKLNSFDELKAEYTSSVYESNNLNEESKSQGGAGLIALSGKDRPVSLLSDYTFSHNLEVQWVQSNFKSLQRLRTVEFERFWLQPDSVGSDDILLSGSGKLEKSADQLFSYNIFRRDRGSNSGWMHQFDVRQKFKDFYSIGNVDLVNSTNSIYESDWLNYNFDFYYKIKNWQPGFRILSERNEVNKKDSLAASANNYYERQIYLDRNVKNTGKINLLYSIREDFHPLAGEFERRSKAHGFTASASYENLDIRLNYRKLELNNAKPEEMLSGDALWKSKIFSILNQEIGMGISQGRELSRAFQFVQVTPGEGTHTWRDMNNDDVKDLDEFFEAINIDERNYIKILIPTNDFTPAYESRLSYRGNIKAPESWRQSKGMAYFISRLRGTVNFQTSQKTSSSEWKDRIIILNGDLADEFMISENQLFNGRIMLNRTREKFGGSINYQHNKRKQLYQVGFQQVEREALAGDFIYSINQYIDINLQSSLMSEMLNNNFSSTVTYDIEGQMINPSIGFTLNHQWRISTGYKLNWKFGHVNESAHKAFNFDVKHSRKETFLNATIRYINVDFQGEEHTAEGYALLEALRPGQNIYWQINLQQKVSKALRLSVFYDGRKSELNQPVHLGRVQLTALF